MRDGDAPAPADAPPSLDSFRTHPAEQSLAAWRGLFAANQLIPLDPPAAGLAGLKLRLKRLLRPLVRGPQHARWERQRFFSLAVVARLEALDRQVQDLWATVWKIAGAHDEKLVLVDTRLDLHEAAISHSNEELAARDERLGAHDQKFESVDGAFAEADYRLGHLEKVEGEGIRDLMRHDDALFALLDQKVDRYRREAAQLTGALQSALARAAAAPAGQPSTPAPDDPLGTAVDEWKYVAFENRFRGTEAEIRERVAAYLPHLAGGGEVLDLGCGRGELLRLLGEHGIPARGVDASGEMVRRCREAGLRADQADLLAGLAATAPASLGGVVAAHVIEHLPPEVVEQLVRLAFGALRPGGVLLLETPNPTSLVVAARNFWLDPTHRRPVHPATLQLLAELAGFDPVEIVLLRPFAAADRLPEIALGEVPAEQAQLADRVNRMRDRLDDLLFGHQDYLLVARKPSP